MKWKIIVTAVILAAIAIYLNYAYSRIFNFISAQNMKYPEVNGIYEITPTSQGSAETITYTALGDSLTAGVGADNPSETFAYLFAKKMSDSGQKIKLVNLGIAGAVSKDVIDSQLAKTISENPRVITLLIGTNDMNNYVPLAEFKTNYETIIRELRAKTTAKILASSIPYLGAPELFLPPYNLFFDLRIRQYNKIIKRIAEENGIILVDLYQETADAFKKDSRLYSPDLFHPSAEGYKLWGDIFYANFR
ncbi:MAG: SGNH/GDSL hydrolase family protein [Patescibacteria group bacterium]